MKLHSTLIAAGSMLAASTAIAQPAPGPAPQGPAAPPIAGQMGTDQGMPSQAAPSAGMGDEQQDFSDAEIENFAAAAVKIQELQADPAMEQQTVQEQAVAIVAESGLTPQSYNSIAQATQTDPEVAERVQLAVADMQGQPES